MSREVTLSWKASSPEKRKLLIAFVLKGAGKPVSYSALLESSKTYFGKKTLDNYLRALLKEHVLQQKLMEGFKRRKGFVVSKAYEKYSDDISTLLAWQEEIKSFNLELNIIQNQLEKTRYGRRMSEDKRKQLIARALESAYRRYIPFHLYLVREGAFYSQSPEHDPLVRLVLRECTDHFLSFATRLRAQVPTETFAIANHEVWGEDQMVGAVPKLIGKMWFQRKKEFEQFLVSEAKLKKKKTFHPRTDLERINEEIALTARLKRVLGDLEMTLGHPPTKKEYVDRLRDQGVPEPERLVEIMIREKLVFELGPGFVTWEETARNVR